MLYYIVAFFQVVFCIALVGLILLHSGKEAGSPLRSAAEWAVLSRVPP